jgi:glycosyltransferase involved in cell wall biosynthesis
MAGIAEDVMLEADSSKHVLVIAPRILTPDIDAGSLRLHHLLIMLKDLSDGVTFIPSFAASWPPYEGRVEEDTERLRQAGVEVPSTSASDPVQHYLQRNGRRYTIVVLCDEYVASKHMAAVRKYCPQSLIVFDTSDLHYVRHYREAKVTGNVRALRRALQSKKRLLAVAGGADFTFVVSPVDKAILERDCPGVLTYVVPSIHEVRGCARPFSDRRDILFIGSFQHSPNLDAVNYFVSEIQPLLRQEIADLRTYIIGGDPPASIRNLASGDTIVTGYVPDIAPYFDNCRVSVAPLRFGSGVKGKVLTSLSYGLPVVASSLATEGMYLTDGEGVLVADNPTDFCKAVVSLYRSENLWAQVSRDGLEVISQHFSVPAVRAQLAQSLASMENAKGL